MQISHQLNLKGKLKVIVLVSSGIDFVNIERLPILPYGLCQRESQSAWTLQETHRNSTNYARDEADRQTP